MENKKQPIGNNRLSCLCFSKCYLCYFTTYDKVIESEKELRITFVTKICAGLFKNTTVYFVTLKYLRSVVKCSSL